jgi:hypothetical protein
MHACVALSSGNAEDTCAVGIVKKKPHSLECGSGWSWRGCSLRSPSLSFRVANQNCPSPDGEVFLILFQSSRQAGKPDIKSKNHFLAEVAVLICSVELAGVEPASKHGSHMLSTCLFLLDFRDLSAAEQPNLPLFPVCFAIGSEQPSD